MHVISNATLNNKVWTIHVCLVPVKLISFRFLSNRTREMAYGRKSPVTVSRKADVLHSSFICINVMRGQVVSLKSDP